MQSVPLPACYEALFLRFLQASLFSWCLIVRFLKSLLFNCLKCSAEKFQRGTEVLPMTGFHEVPGRDAGNRATPVRSRWKGVRLSAEDEAVSPLPQILCHRFYGDRPWVSAAASKCWPHGVLGNRHGLGVTVEMGCLTHRIKRYLEFFFILLTVVLWSAYP